MKSQHWVAALLLIGLVACSPAPTATNTPVPTVTTALTPTSIPTETVAPTAIKADDKVLGAYTTLTLLKTNQVLLEETATAIRDEKLTGFKSLGALITVGALISATEQSLAQPVPAPELSQAWEDGRSANAQMLDLTRRWLDKAITSNEVLDELPAITEQIDSAISQAQAVLAEKYGVDEAQLKEGYDKAIQDARDKFQKLLST
jgi:hypothetical protein